MRALRLALHPGTGDAESKAAMLGVLRIARGSNIDSEAFVRILSSNHDSCSDDHQDDDVTRSDLCDIEFPFGKYKGSTMAQIARMDFGYLRWIATKFGEYDDPFRVAANEVIRFMAAGGRL